MARTNPAHSGYIIQNGAGTGENGKRIDVWVEYYIGTYNIEKNTTPFKAYFYAALNPSYSSNTSYNSGLNSTFYVDGAVVSTVKDGSYDFRSSSILNILGSYSGDIAHNDNGTRQVKISGSFTTNSSYITGGSVAEFVITLPTIPRASGIDSVSNVTLGNNCSVKWTPKGTSLRYRLAFSYGNWSAMTELIHPNSTSQFTYTGFVLPLELAQQFTEISASVKVVLYTYADSAGQNNIGSFSTQFTATIPTDLIVTTIDKASNVTLGNNCSVMWTPGLASLRYRLVFSCGQWSETSGLIHPNKTSQYTYNGMVIPLDVARQFDPVSTTMKVTLYTYTDSAGNNQAGTDDAYFTVVVPENESTKPVVSMTLTPGTTPIAGLYIQGLSNVKADISATDPYGASIDGYSISVGGETYSNPYTSDYLNSTGTVKLTGYAVNSRGFVGSTESSIEVIEYSRPQLQNVSAERCTADGTKSEDGTYMKLSATRKYSKVMSSGKQNNFCSIRFRYKADTDSNWSEWTTILAENAGVDSVTTAPLLGNLSTDKGYTVQINATDTLGYPANATLWILSKSVFMHRRAGGKAMGLGKKVERDNLLDVAWDAVFRGTTTVGTPVNDTDAVNKAYVDGLIADLKAKHGL